MNILDGDYFTIERKGNRYVFSGDMLSPEYPAVTGFFARSFPEITEEKILFDFKQLNYLNTRGMSVLSHAIARLPKHQRVQFITNKDISWHQVCIEGFALICPGKIERPV